MKTSTHSIRTALFKG